jgi:hypothetical protein
MGTSENPIKFVAPSEVGGQSTVESMCYEGLDSSLRRNDGSIEVSRWKSHGLAGVSGQKCLKMLAHQGLRRVDGVMDEQKKGASLRPFL